MTNTSHAMPTVTTTATVTNWLKSYYFTRAAFSIVWVAAALTVATTLSVVQGTLLLVYPAWDAVANLVDARRNGGVRHNPTQVLNAVVSGVTTVAVAIALRDGMNTVLAVFGAWAALAGLFQLATGVRRWKGPGSCHRQLMLQRRPGSPPCRCDGVRGVSEPRVAHAAAVRNSSPH